jgi:hypothetical protein
MQMHRERPIEILTKANPEKLGDVHKIVEAFAYRERKPSDSLDKKHGLTTGERSPGSGKMSTGPSRPCCGRRSAIRSWARTGWN